MMASQNKLIEHEESGTNVEYRAIIINDEEEEEHDVSLEKKGKFVRFIDNDEKQNARGPLKRLESFPPGWPEEEDNENVRSLERKAKSLPSWAASSSSFQEESTRNLRRKVNLESSVVDKQSSWRIAEEEEEEELYNKVVSPSQTEDEADDLSNRIKRRVKHMPFRPLRTVQEQVRLGEHVFSSAPIFRFPRNLEGIIQNATQPELVTIGPYHRDKHEENRSLLDFEEHKWYFLSNFVSRAKGSGKDVSFFLRKLRRLELLVKSCYQDGIPPMSSSDDEFVEMMFLDGCFVVEVLYHIGAGGIDEDNDPVLTRPWLIPVLIRDLLKLDNQLPYFVLELLYESSWSPERVKNYPLPLLALKTFNAVFPRPDEFLEGFKEKKGKHLLDLFYCTLIPPSVEAIQRKHITEYYPIQSVSQLRSSGVKFQSRKSDSFLDIKFCNAILEIPSFAVNEFTSTVLINCVALEQCYQMQPKYLTDYVYFISCLLNKTRDVAFLSSDGVILRSIQDDVYISEFFNDLGQKFGSNIRDSYQSEHFRKINSYYESPYASLRRKYYSDPLSALSFYAIIILGLTVIQTVTSIVS